jgi:hypothetical protein
MFAVLLILLEPHGTGLPVHEWLGIAIGVPILTHLLLNWQWVVTVTKKMFAPVPLATRVCQVLNTVLFVATVVAIQSGVMISEVALPSVANLLGFSGAWRPLHEVSTNAMVLGAEGTPSCTGVGSPGPSVACLASGSRPRWPLDRQR